jgi:arsenate reductase
VKVVKDKTVLFICKGNSGRSQMAEAFFNKFSKAGKAISAGIEPDEKVHPQTIQTMKEVGIDVSKQKTKLLTDELMEKSDKIIVMDSDLVKYIPKKYLSKLENWEIDKVLGKSLEEVNKIRDKIEAKVKRSIKKYDKFKSNYLAPSASFSTLALSFTASDLD